MDYLEPMTAAVRAAANIYRSAKNDLHIEVKGEDKNNLVTAYDKHIQDFLYKELSAAFPGCAFLGAGAGAGAGAEVFTGSTGLAGCVGLGGSVSCVPLSDENSASIESRSKP